MTHTIVLLQIFLLLYDITISHNILMIKYLEPQKTFWGQALPPLQHGGRVSNE